MLVTLFWVACLINLVYEILHSVLYTTCLNASWKTYAYLMLKGALFDGTVITIFFATTYTFFKEYYIAPFIIISLAFAYIWEVYSLKKGTWEYSEHMPTVFLVDVTPLIQLAATGMGAIYITMYIL